MLIFAIAFVPEGNMIRLLRKLRASPARSGDLPDASALPEGIYWGFFSPGTSKPSEKELARSFRRSSEGLFKALPPLLLFTTSVFLQGKWYIAPDPPLPASIAGLAEEIAANAGFVKAQCQPFVPGTGFFAGIDVTPAPFEAFSFRHLDAVLLKIESEDARFDKAWWTVLERASRRTGPREKNSQGKAKGSP